MSSSSDIEISSDNENSANSAIGSLIPEKSKIRYALAYQKFENWCEYKKMKAVNEKVLLAYFESLKTMKASTLWTTYSMLRAELTVRKNIDIKKYTKLIAWLKKQSAGYHAKKSRIFTKDNVESFIKEAEDEKFLFAKVAMIIGIAGACRKSELTFLREKDVSDEGLFFKITIPETKTHGIREFAVTAGNISDVNFVDLIRKYKNMRPSITRHDRFFVKYFNGKCGAQPVGINTFGKLPTTIAQFLGLPNPKAYTGHCFRRSSASLLADSEVGDLLIIEQHGGWESSSVAEGMEPIIIVHGGAGDISTARVPGKINGVKCAVKAGYKILQEGGSALDATEAAVRIMEGDENFNAGYGSVLNLDGEVEMGASIMNGVDLNAGAVALVQDVANPITLARKVMECTPHTLLGAQGASRFAREQGIPAVDPKSLVSEHAKEALEHFKRTGYVRTEIGPKSTTTTDQSGGTVGAVALDKNGNIAAATSTGGLNGKMVGRIGDTPQIGSGTYADNLVGAVSTTGIIRNILKALLN